MNVITSTEDLCGIETKQLEENILLEIIKELCSKTDSKLSSKLIGKVKRIMADCDLTHYSSLYKCPTADSSTATILGFVNKTSIELTFDEQTELNEAILQRIQAKLPEYNAELEQLQQCVGAKKSRNSTVQELQKSLEEKLQVLAEQEEEKVSVMMEWLNHKMQNVVPFTNTAMELLTLKTKILDVKSRILHLQLLQHIYTDTNKSIKAYTEVHRDLTNTIRDTEGRIEKYKEIIDKHSAN